MLHTARAKGRQRESKMGKFKKKKEVNRYKVYTQGGQLPPEIEEVTATSHKKALKQYLENKGVAFKEVHKIDVGVMAQHLGSGNFTYYWVEQTDIHPHYSKNFGIVQ